MVTNQIYTIVNSICDQAMGDTLATIDTQGLIGQHSIKFLYYYRGFP